LDSYRAALEEFNASNAAIDILHDPDEFDQWKATIFEYFEDHRMGRNLPEGYVPDSTFWLVDGDTYLGTGNIRHRLTPELEQFGGHIGYAIRPSYWNMGYGTLQLRLLLAEAAKLGLTHVLLTCDESNLASARVMEKCGGVWQDTIEQAIGGPPRRTRRYWIATKQ